MAGYHKATGLAPSMRLIPVPFVEQLPLPIGEFARCRSEPNRRLLGLYMTLVNHGLKMLSINSGQCRMLRAILHAYLVKFDGSEFGQANIMRATMIN